MHFALHEAFPGIFQAIILNGMVRSDIAIIVDRSSSETQQHIQMPFTVEQCITLQNDGEPC